MAAYLPEQKPELSPFPSRHYLKDKHEPNRYIGRLGRLTQDSLQDGHQRIV